MVNKLGSNFEEENRPEIKINLQAPKTAEKWCELYRVLSGRDVYVYLNWGSEAELHKLLSYEEFKAKVFGVSLDINNIPFIDAVDRFIQNNS
ncbi:hypothetical protein CVV38_02480 [Candidatus Peregrinibacteria bacterium HGW-Peregrinibacteria-1]|jgi:hypothetical protein|nr:MAG: hypothetical protein CVV38_02480 [Candidatus Peregrinibacteria bacterium HGW-Peregrinibacteria-1]